jgi:tetratricopeptide (TPR) repeat protein
MKQWAYFIFISLSTVICICLIALNISSVKRVSSTKIELERYKTANADLEGQLRKASSERDLANQKVSRLEQEVSVLLERQKADRRAVEDLRKTLNEKQIAEAKQDTGGQKVSEQEPQQSIDAENAREVREPPVQYDAESVMKMISSGSLKDAINQIITSEGIDSTLQQHSEDPAHWAAAASLAQDPNSAVAYLEQAAGLYPDSPMLISSLINAQIASKRIDESTMADIDQMKKVDPTNALADCYAAYCQFSSGDVEGALQSLSQAGVKDRFADDSIDLMMARYDYFLNEGCSDSVSLGLSAFDLPLSQMGMLRELSDYAIKQADAFYAAGRYEDALRITTDTSKLGATLSSSGRFIVSDRVGMALQISALGEAKQIYEALGDAAKVTEIDSQLQAVQQRSGEIDVMVQTFGSVLQNMTDQDIADYVNSTILNGEFSTLQNMPEIAAALEQARVSSSSGQSGAGSTDTE